jgi:hypothetical protein
VTRTIALDFDGVIHAYSRGWQDGTIYDEPLPGALAGIKKLQSLFAVFVLTSRNVQQVTAWLLSRKVDALADGTPLVGRPAFWNSQDFVLVTNRKLPAVAYVDDRAVLFTYWSNLLTLYDLPTEEE